jgi:hypothetical protein
MSVVRGVLWTLIVASAAVALGVAINQILNGGV